MKLTRLSGTCTEGDCPAIYATDRGSIVVQGVPVTEGLSLPEGESAVEIPASVFEEAARAARR